MSSGSDPASLRRGRITYFPVVPGRLEFAAAVRAHILEHQPAIVAVELPTSLEPAYLRAVRRLPRITAIVYPDDNGSEEAIVLPVEPADPFTEAVRTALDTAAQPVFLEPDDLPRPHLSDYYPDPAAIPHIALEKYIEAYRVYPQQRSEEIDRHAAGMAWKLQGCDPEAETVVVVSLNLLDPLLDAMQIPQDEPRLRRRDPVLINPHPDCLNEITVEYPYLQARYEQYRRQPADTNLIDRLRSQFDLFRDAGEAYQTNTGDRLTHWHRRLLARYTRNLASTDNQLVAGLFDLVLAARSIVDDNYGWEVWETAGRYPWQQAEDDIETQNLSGNQVFLNTRRLRLRRRLPRPKQRLRPRGLKERKKEKHPGEWAAQLDGNSICSYPPEDIVVENYGRFLKQKARSMISEERSRVEPFTTSMLDGIDIRETIRNWHRRKIFVRSQQHVRGEAGAVVVIFDEDRDGRYDYLTTWLGENQNESDMAFYSTNPFDHLVGPGIGRAEYGGFLLTLPPRRMFDVWGDPDYDLAETKAERLLLAAMDYSVHRNIVYVASRPPRSLFRTIAARLGRTILYLPSGQLSPSRLKKLRVVHVLDSRARRDEAKDYLW